MDLVTKTNTEIQTKSLTKMKYCKAGLEVHFKEAEGCRAKNKKTRRRRGVPCLWCGICINYELSS